LAKAQAKLEASAKAQAESEDLSKAGSPAALFGGLARHPLGGLKGSVNPQLNPSFSNPRSAAEILGAKRRFRNVFIRNPVFQRSNPPFKNYKPLIQKP
jgi:hypothetical protein